MGLDDARVARLRARMAREVDEGLLPSCSAAVGLDGDVVWAEAFGEATTDTRYVVFSETKALVAAVAWQLFGEGRMHPDDPVVEHFAEFGENGKAEVTVGQLLTHTAGFPRAPMNPSTWGDRAARVERMRTWRLNWEPGTQFEYHPTSAHWVLAELIERLDGRPCGASVAERIAEPLGLTGLALGVPPEQQAGIAVLEAVGETPSESELEAVLGVAGLGVAGFDFGEVTPDALVEFNAPEAKAAGVPGGGAVARATDMALFYQALLHDTGDLWDPGWLHEGTGHVHNTFPDPMLGHPANRTLGLVVAGDDDRAFLRGMGRTVSARAFGHNGAAGQIAWADPGTGLSFCYLTNGVERHFLREARRVTAIASCAGALTTP